MTQAGPAGPVWLVGDVVLDVMLPERGSSPVVRLGGVMHAARALWAARLPYSVCYIAPEYLVEEFENFASRHDARSCVRGGTVVGSPNVMLVAEPSEAGPQGYEFLLREGRRVEVDRGAVEDALTDAKDVLLVGDEATVNEVGPAIRDLNATLHVDADVEPERVAHEVGAAETLIYSTSSETFRTRFDQSVDSLRAATVGQSADSLLFKENRGGTRLYSSDRTFEVPAHVGPVAHSVGVGDCFDALYVSLRREFGEQPALAFAAAAAADYASTIDPDELSGRVAGTLAVPVDEIVAMAGVRVPWEERGRFSVYVAAPDFDWVDTRPIDALARALEYHGFRPRRPVVEIGQLAAEATAPDRRRVLTADLELLGECQLLVAVVLHDDPGTFVEIGLAAERGMPVVVYDPYGRADDPFTAELPNAVGATLDEVISAVFQQVNKLL